MEEASAPTVCLNFKIRPCRPFPEVLSPLGMGELEGEELSVSPGPKGRGPSSCPGKGVLGLGCSTYSGHPPCGVVAGEHWRYWRVRFLSS